MQIVSYNVAGLRAQIKKPEFQMFIDANIDKLDIICLQETKAEEKQVDLPENIKAHYPYRFWNSTKGTTQRKGLSGVAIWSRIKPMNTNIDIDIGIGSVVAEFDEEGRILAVEFETFILVNVYVPNSQKLDSPRYYFRESWNHKFIEYINKLKVEFPSKEIVICGDMNVAHLDIDICNPKHKKNKVPGFFDNERSDFTKLLEQCALTDVYRVLNPSSTKSTYWSNFMKTERTMKNGWGIDYFLVSQNMFKADIINECRIHMNVLGSDHCPVSISLNA
jgi:exodeoxyribonuclease III